MGRTDQLQSASRGELRARESAVAKSSRQRVMCCGCDSAESC